MKEFVWVTDTNGKSIAIDISAITHIEDYRGFRSQSFIHLSNGAKIESRENAAVLIDRIKRLCRAAEVAESGGI